MTGSTSTGQPSVFVTTRWSVVLAAREKASPQSDEALETLCRAYWFPLYAHARRIGHPPHDAEDLTQEFFARLLAKEWLRAADPERGRFRSFLLVCFKRFMAKEWRAASARKRGGDQPRLSLDTAQAESRLADQAVSPLPEDAAFDRQWALTLLEQAMTRLQEEYDRAGKTGEYMVLKDSLTAERGSMDYDAIARKLGASEGAARVAVHRLRNRFRETFRSLVAETVAQGADLEDEIRHLAAALAQ